MSIKISIEEVSPGWTQWQSHLVAGRNLLAGLSTEDVDLVSLQAQFCVDSQMSLGPVGCLDDHLGLGSNIHTQASNTHNDIFTHYKYTKERAFRQTKVTYTNKGHMHNHCQQRVAIWFHVIH